MGQTLPVMVVSSRPVEFQETYSAAIRGRQDVDIIPQVSGRITRLCVKDPAFAEGFSLAPELGVLERIPVRRYTDAYSGLWGAAWLAGQLAVGNTTDS